MNQGTIGGIFEIGVVMFGADGVSNGIQLFNANDKTCQKLQ